MDEPAKARTFDENVKTVRVPVGGAPARDNSELELALGRTAPGGNIHEIPSPGRTIDWNGLLHKIGLSTINR